MKYAWRKITNENYDNCGSELLFVNKINIGGYYHTLIRNAKRGDYCGDIYLPGVKKHKVYGTRESVKTQLIELADKWFEEINKGAGEEPNAY
jgi:hypothetical protein